MSAEDLGELASIARLLIVAFPGIYRGLEILAGIVSSLRFSTGVL